MYEFKMMLYIQLMKQKAIKQAWKKKNHVISTYRATWTRYRRESLYSLLGASNKTQSYECHRMPQALDHPEQCPTNNKGVLQDLLGRYHSIKIISPNRQTSLRRRPKYSQFRGCA